VKITKEILKDLEELGRIGDVVAVNIETQEEVCFIPQGLLTPEDLPSFMMRNSDEGFSCHNGIGFDLKVLKKLYNYEYKGLYRDTLLMSRILWPDIEGGNSVDAWGKRFGIEKPRHEDWTQFSEEMLHRCVEDTKIQARLYEHIQDHIADIGKKDSRIDLDKVFRLEHKVWEIIERQAAYGWQFDLPSAIRENNC